MIHYENVQLNREIITTNVGDVPVLYWLPENKNAPVIIAFHYQTGSKESWLNDDFNKLLSHAIESQSAFIACDIYGHGEWIVEGFDPTNISDDLWDDFVESSALGINAAITSILDKQQRITSKRHFVASSVGCLIALHVMKNGFQVNTLVLSSPLPEKEYDDHTSLHNNLNVFSMLPLLVLTGESDEEVASGEVEWLFNLVKSTNKELVVYESGHSLPIQWLDKTIEFLQAN